MGSANGTKHSLIVEKDSFTDVCYIWHSLTVDSYSSGTFKDYPPGIINPSFAGNFIWEIKENHPFNEYRIPKECNIWCGVVIRGSMIFVYMPITNNDIISYIKQIISQLQTPETQESSISQTKKIVHYIQSAQNHNPIPSIYDKKKFLQKAIKLDVDSCGDNSPLFSTLLYRIYLLTFMLHYRMPIQRRWMPGNRNNSRCRSKLHNRGWLSLLGETEQQILLNPSFHLSSDDLPEDNICGITEDQTYCLSKVSYVDHLNSSMHRNSFQTEV